mmetsp:Transcript_1423/g.3809  ORF Transcript_1423/g.3809 Transcript_1423/m.3809 type:complete len:246 (+) Transcript_1423:101-838(+)
MGRRQATVFGPLELSRLLPRLKPKKKTARLTPETVDRAPRTRGSPRASAEVRLERQPLKSQLREYGTAAPTLLAQPICAHAPGSLNQAHIQVQFSQARYSAKVEDLKQERGGFAADLSSAGAGSRRESRSSQSPHPLERMSTASPEVRASGMRYFLACDVIPRSTSLSRLRQARTQAATATSPKRGFLRTDRTCGTWKRHAQPGSFWVTACAQGGSLVGRVANDVGHGLGDPPAGVGRRGPRGPP